MTSLTGMSKKRTSFSFEGGITLIELMLVMAMIATIMAIAAPRLSGFFRGRDLLEETRRFVAVTRYGRSEAISRSVLMEMWVDTSEGKYGLNPQSPSEAESSKDVEFELADGLSFEIDEESLDDDGKAHILFWPDGSIDIDSVEAVRIVQTEDKFMEIAQTEFGMGYAVETGEDDYEQNRR